MRKHTQCKLFKFYYKTGANNVKIHVLETLQIILGIIILGNNIVIYKVSSYINTDSYTLLSD